MATIFIVDDDQAIGEMLSLVLENEGFQTVTCLSTRTKAAVRRSRRKT